MSCRGWREYCLGDISNMKYGKMPKKDKIRECGYPIFSGYRITGYYDEYMLENPELIVIARGVGGTGDVKLSPAKSYITNLSIIVSINEEIVDKEFLYYKLKNENLRNLDSGSAQSQITINDLSKYKITIPILEEQVKIKRILTALDKKIELNNEMNKTLEEMAQALFKRWFVDFEFPNEEGKPYKSSGGEMIESEMGMIPNGWSIKNLSELGKIVTGKTPSTKDKENYGDDFNFITPVDMSNNCYIINSQRKLSQQGYQKINKLMIPPNSIGVTCIGSNLGEVYLNAKEGFTNQQINTLILNNQNFYPYVYMVLKNMKNDFLNIASGSAVPIINKTTFSNINVVYPNERILEIFCEKISCFFNKLKENLINNIALMELRDSLLPKLMNGEIQVNDIKANV